MTTFVDRAVLHAVAGDGGNGIASVHREKFKPLGGPDGGNGGRGGDVILEVTSDTASLLDIQHHPHRRAGSGAHGSGGNRSGADGDDVVVSVPEGTVVLDEHGEQMVDLVGAGTRFVIARGGRGGLGNAALASARRKAPGFALLGEAGERRDVTLELKMVADVGLIGFPSAGKSSLVSVLSAAKPKIADYPFTTLAPNLGVVSAGDTTFTVADVPGLIPGASQGKGLGLEFLRHIERCAALVHVVDCATLEPGRDPVSDVQTIEAELAQYGGLADRPRLVVLNKVDVPEAADLAEMVRPMLEDEGYQVFEVSAVSHEGLRPLTFAMASLVERARAERAAAEEEAPRVLIRPVPVDDTGFEVRLETTPDGDELYRVVGARPERWVRQTDFSNDEAVGYLADRLARLGVEERLAELGAPTGCDVVIGPGDDAVIFAFEPAVAAGDSERDADGPRGGDVRVWHHEDARAERRAVRRAHQQARGRRRPRPGDQGSAGAGGRSADDAAGPKGTSAGGNDS